jgi:hypothetical protein
MQEIEPTPKSEVVDELLQQLMGKNRIATIKQRKCMTCDRNADYFRDNLSLREYTISGMCQRCQDKVFGTEEW